MSTEGGQWFSAFWIKELRERQTVRIDTTLDHDGGDEANCHVTISERDYQ